MDRIQINLDLWEFALSPIDTRNVDKDKAERMLYQSAIKFYTKEVVEDYIANKDYYDGDGWTSHYEHFCEWLCAEEEALVIENGGRYIED